MILVDNYKKQLIEKLLKWSFSFFIAVGFFSITGCAESEKDEETEAMKKMEISGEAQGTTYSIVYFTEDSTISKYAVDSIFTAIDMAASIWVDSSIISLFNQSADSLFEVPLSNNRFFIENFMLSKDVFRATNGAYNPTVGELVNAWGFGLKNREVMDSTKVDSLLQSVGFSDDQMNLFTTHSGSTFIRKANPNTQLDFNGIAQGYTVDILAEYFKSHGVNNFMIEVGGELRANGRKPDGSLWKIGIDKPEKKNLERKLSATLQLDNMAVATSGNYRKFYEENGVRYAHTIDPVTGFPVQHSLLSVTVVMKNCGLADAYATAFMVLGVDKTKEFISQNPELGINVFLIYSDEVGGYSTFISPGLEENLTEL